MALESLYRPESAGDWGVARVVEGGAYGTDTLARPGGVAIFFRYWQQPNPQAPVLVLLHGLGAHTGWFLHFASALHARGLTIYALDHRGFGRSGGPRGHVRRGITFIEDIEAFLDEAGRRQPGAPRVLLGHSMGGLFAAHAAARDARLGRDRLAGIILVNPWIRDTSKASLAALATVLFGGPLGSKAVPPGTDSSKTDTMTTNPEAVRMLLADERWVRRRTASFYFQVALQLRGQVLRRAREVRAPALVIQTEADRAVVAAASLECFKALGSVDKTWTSIPLLAHDFEFEPERGPLDDEIAGWMARFAV